jgi:hypothetical protein
MKGRLYLSGPMSGLPDLNFPVFHAAAAALRADGWTVINPAEITTDHGARWEDCLRLDIAQLVTCEAIALLPGWEKSEGATLEAHIAAKLKMPHVAVVLAPSSHIAFAEAPQEVE